MALFSGRSRRLAAMFAADQASAARDQSLALLGQGRTDALAALGQGRDAIGTGRDQGLAALGQNYDRARSDVTMGFGNALGELGVLDPWVDAGRNALGTYQGSLGLGGQANRDAAVSAYRTSPGYERRVAEATDAVARQASALGALGSGNTMQAISDRANHLADEDYGRWQGQVAGLSDRGQQAATTQGTTRAGLQGQLGQSLANLGQSQGRDTAGLYTDAAARQAGLYGQEAGLHMQNAGLGAGILGNSSQQIIDAGTAGLRAGDQASANRLNLLGQGINFGTRLLGGFI